jgi:hypothetical protein
MSPAFALATVGGLAFAIADAPAQTLQILDRPSTQLTLPGTVDATLVRPDGSILVGGRFDLAQREVRDGLAKLDASGELDPAFDLQCRETRILEPYGVPRCRVQALLALPDGGVLVGGAFTHLGGLARAGLARLLPNGAVDPAWAAMQIAPDRVVELDRTPSGIVVGMQTGNQSIHLRISTTTGAIDSAFPSMSSLRRWIVDRRARSFVWRVADPALVRLSVDEVSVDATWQSGLPAGFSIVDIAYHPGVDRLFAAVVRLIPDGQGGTTAESGVIRFDPQGPVGYETGWTLDFSGSDPGPEVRWIRGLFAGDDPRLFLDVTIGAAGSGGLIAVDPISGRVLSGPRPAGGTPDRFRALAEAGDGRLLVAAFDPDASGSVSPGGSALARLRPDLSLDTSFTPRIRAVGSASSAVLAGDGAVVVQGSFTRADDQQIATILRLRPDLTLDTNWVPFATAGGAGLSSPAGGFWVHAIDGAGRVYLVRSVPGGIFPPGGDFAQFQRLDRATGRLDADWAWFGSGLVFSAAFDAEGRFYTGHAGGLSGCDFGAGLLARLRVEMPCTADPTWRPSLSGDIVSRVVPDAAGNVYVVGRFAATAADGSLLHGIARIPTSSPPLVDASWRPGPTDPDGKPAAVADIALHGGSIYVSGEFSRIAGEPWRGIARLSPSNAALDRAWNAGDQRYTSDLVVGEDEMVYSIDRESPFAAAARVVVRATTGNGQPSGATLLQGPQPDAESVVALPDGGAIIAGRFVLADGGVRTGLMAVGTRPRAFFSDGFEPR